MQVRWLCSWRAIVSMEGVENFSSLAAQGQEKIQNRLRELKGVVQYTQQVADEVMPRVCDACIEEMCNLSSDFKYIANGFLKQKGESGSYLCNSTFWDTEKDGAFSARYENGSIICQVTIFATAI